MHTGSTDVESFTQLSGNVYDSVKIRRAHLRPHRVQDQQSPATLGPFTISTTNSDGISRPATLIGGNFRHHWPNLDRTTNHLSHLDETTTTSSRFGLKAAQDQRYSIGDNLQKKRSFKGYTASLNREVLFKYSIFTPQITHPFLFLPPKH